MADDTPVAPQPAKARRRLARVLAWPVALLVAVLPWAWFAVRDLSPVLDLVAIGLPLLVLGGLLGVLVAEALTRSRAWLVSGASLVIFGVVAIMLPWSPLGGPAPSRPIVLLAANVAGPETPEPAGAVVGSVLDADADVLVIDELSPLIADLLQASYPYHVKTFAEGDRSPQPPAVGVFSRLPIVDAQVELDGLPGVRVVIDAASREDGKFVLYGAHVPKAGPGGGYATSFGGHDAIIGDLARAAASEQLPVIVAGDLNTPDRSAGYRELTEHLVDGGRADGWTGPTSVKDSVLWRLLALRVDHVLHSPGWCSAEASRVTLAGSDHRGVRVEVGPCPS